MIGRLKNSFPGRLAVAYGQSQAGRYAAALAFNSFMTMFPVILGILTIIGVVIHDPTTQQKVQESIISVFPQEAHKELLQALTGVKHSAGILGIISIVGLLVTATGYFSSMEWALTQIFGSKQRDAIRQRVMGLIMMVVFVVAIVVAVAANGAAAIIPFAPVGGVLVGLVVMLILFLAIYRFVPNRTFSTRDVLPGALFAAVLTEILTIVFPLYARIAHGFNTYGSQFAIFFIIATWLFFLAQLLLLGAVFIRLRVGAPADEGVVSADSADSKAPPSPVGAIEAQQEKAEKGLPADAPAPSGKDSGAHQGSGAQPRRREKAAVSQRGEVEDTGRPPRRPVTGPKRAIMLVAGSMLGLFFASRRRPLAR